MTGKEFLQQYAEAVRISGQLREEYNAEIMMLDDIKSGLGRSGTHGGTGKAIEHKAVRLADKALELRKAELEAVRVRQIVYNAIRKVPGDAGTILYERYINLRSWNEISERVGYSIRQTMNLQNVGIAYLERK